MAKKPNNDPAKPKRHKHVYTTVAGSKTSFLTKGREVRYKVTTRCSCGKTRTITTKS